MMLAVNNIYSQQAKSNPNPETARYELADVLHGRSSAGFTYCNPALNYKL